MKLPPRIKEPDIKAICLFYKPYDEDWDEEGLGLLFRIPPKMVLWIYNTYKDKYKWTQT
jgi:hypothetical protein